MAINELSEKYDDKFIFSKNFELQSVTGVADDME